MSNFEVGTRILIVVKRAARTSDDVTLQKTEGCYISLISVYVHNSADIHHFRFAIPATLCQYLGRNAIFHVHREN